MGCTGVAFGLVIGVAKFACVVVVVVVVVAVVIGGMGHSYVLMVRNGNVGFSDDEAIEISSNFVVVVVVISISVKQIIYNIFT